MSLPYQHPPLKEPQRGLIARIQAVWQGLLGQKRTLSGEQSTDTTFDHNPSTFDTKMVVLEYDRRSIAQDIQRLFDDDPRLAEAAESMGRDAVEGGMRVQVMPRSGAGPESVAGAQQVLDDLLPRLNGILPSVFTNIVLDGEIFLSPVVSGTRVEGFKTPVAVSMERLDDERGNFINLAGAFRQIDLGNFTVLETFPLWQINHIRYGMRPGDKYGRSRFVQARGPLRYVEQTENDMVVARKTRAPLRRFHKVGSQENPGNWVEVAAYKAANSFEDPRKQLVTTDYFGNGLTDVSNLDGQSNLDKIEDVEYLQRVALTRMGKPMALMPAFGQNINRDILEKQEQEYNKLLNGLRHLVENGDGGLYSGLRDLLDFALSIAGINPDTVSYNIQWPRHLSAEQLNFVDKVAGWVATSFIDHETGLAMAAPILGIESAKDVLAKIAQQRSDRQAEQDAADREFAASQTGAGKGVPTVPGEPPAADDTAAAAEGGLVQ